MAQLFFFAWHPSHHPPIPPLWLRPAPHSFTFAGKENKLLQPVGEKSYYLLYFFFRIETHRLQQTFPGWHIHSLHNSFLDYSIFNLFSRESQWQWSCNGKIHIGCWLLACEHDHQRRLQYPAAPAEPDGACRLDIGALIRFTLSTRTGLKALPVGSSSSNEETQAPTSQESSATSDLMCSDRWWNITKCSCWFCCAPTDNNLQANCWKRVQKLKMTPMLLPTSSNVSYAVRLQIIHLICCWSHYKRHHMTGPLNCFMSVPPHQTEVMPSGRDFVEHMKTDYSWRQP